MEFGERLSENVIGDLVVVDVQPLEDGLIQSAPILLAGLSVHLLWIAQQFERGIDERNADLEPVVGPFELFFELRSLGGDPAQSRPHLVLRSDGVACQIEQVVFLAVELGQMVSDLLTQEFRGALLIVESLVKVVSYSRGELLGESDRPIVARNGVFDIIDLGVASEAGPILLATAEEVEVFATVLTDRALNEKATFVSVIVALAAPNTALEVVRVLTESFAGRGSSFEDRLDAFEEFLADEWLVSALIELAVVGDDAEVVGVTQHRLEF